MFKTVLSIATIAAAALASTSAQARAANADEVYLLKNNILIIADARLDGHLRAYTNDGYGMIISEDWSKINDQRLSGNGVACYLSLTGVAPVGRPSTPIIYQMTCGSDSPSYFMQGTDVSVTRRYSSIKELVADTKNLYRLTVRIFENRDTRRETGEPRKDCDGLPGCAW
jgi:hypothetical protein